MTKMNTRVTLSYLCILIGYSMFGIYAFSLRFNYDFPLEAYWLSFVFVSIPLFYEAAVWKGHPKLRLIYLLAFSLIIHLQYAVVDSSPFLLSRDAIADYKLTDRIVSEARWMPFEPVTWFLGREYRFYPITNFVYATMSMLTGIPTLLVVKYLLIITALVVPLLTNKWLRNFFDPRIAYLATAVFLSSPGAVIFPHKEGLAMVFFLAGTYTCTKLVKNRQSLIIGLISIFILTMTHHFTTYVFLGILTSLLLSRYISKREETIHMTTQLILFGFVLFAAWASFIALSVTLAHQRILFNIFLNYLLPGQMVFSELMPYYVFHERMLVYSGYAITLISAGLGFLYYIRKNLSSRFLPITLFLASLAAGGTILRFVPLGLPVALSHRVYEFGYIALGLLSAVFFIYLVRSGKKLTLYLAISALTVMMMTGPLAGPLHPANFVRASKVVSSGALSINAWMNESASPYENTLGDPVGFMILSGYGSIEVDIVPELFTDSYFMPERAAFVVTYVYMADFYGTNLSKFDNSPSFNNLYNNGLLTVYLYSTHPIP